MLPQDPNVTVTIYRNFDPTQPYPEDGTPAAVLKVAGYLKHHMKNGRFGHANGLFWTHLLYLEDMVDIREAYNSQLGGEDATQADTVLIGDYPLTRYCCAFYVVAVQRVPELSLLRVYLDRLQPQDSPCPQQPQILVQFCGQCRQVAEYYELSLPDDFTNYTRSSPPNCDLCQFLNNRKFKLKYTPTAAFPTCHWQSETFATLCGPIGGFYASPMRWELAINGFGWSLFIDSTFYYFEIPIDQFNCLGSNTFLPRQGPPDGGPATCLSRKPATLKALLPGGT